MPLTFEEGERPKLQNRSPIFCHKRHISTKSITIIQVFTLVLFVPFAANTSSWLLLAHVVAMDIAILLLAVLCFREDVFVVFASHHSDAWRHFLCRRSGFL